MPKVAAACPQWLSLEGPQTRTLALPCRGLSEALSAEATAIGRRQLQQPWVLTSLRAHGGGGGGDAAGEQQQGGSSPALALGDAAAGSSSQAGAEAAAAPRQR